MWSNEPDYGRYDLGGYCWKHNRVTRGFACDLCLDEARDEGLDLEEQEFWDGTTVPEEQYVDTE